MRQPLEAADQHADPAAVDAVEQRGAGDFPCRGCRLQHRAAKDRLALHRRQRDIDGGRRWERDGIDEFDDAVGSTGTLENIDPVGGGIRDLDFEDALARCGGLGIERQQSQAVLAGGQCRGLLLASIGRGHDRTQGELERLGGFQPRAADLAPGRGRGGVLRGHGRRRQSEHRGTRLLFSPAFPNLAVRTEVERERARDLGEHVVRGRGEVDPDRLQPQRLPVSDDVAQPARVHRNDQSLFAARDAADRTESGELFDHRFGMAVGHPLSRAGEIALLQQVLRFLEAARASRGKPR